MKSSSTKKSLPQKSLRDRIERAIARSESNSRRVGEGVIKSTNQLCYDFPWNAAGPRPWKDGYTRVIIPLPTPTRKGKRCLVQIVHNSNLSHGAKGGKLI